MKNLTRFFCSLSILFTFQGGSAQVQNSTFSIDTIYSFVSTNSISEPYALNIVPTSWHNDLQSGERLKVMFAVNPQTIYDSVHIELTLDVVDISIYSYPISIDCSCECEKDDDEFDVDQINVSYSLEGSILLRIPIEAFGKRIYLSMVSNNELIYPRMAQAKVTMYADQDEQSSITDRIYVPSIKL